MEPYFLPSAQRKFDPGNLHCLSLYCTMRLLKAQDNGNVSLTGDLRCNILPYAILSLTWESDVQEVRLNGISAHVQSIRMAIEQLTCAKSKPQRMSP